jgi:hypothetical protein
MAPGPSRRVQVFLRQLEPLALAALLRELGLRLYELEVRDWRALVTLSQEIIDQTTEPEKALLFERWLRKPLAHAETKQALRAKRRSRRKA